MLREIRIRNFKAWRDTGPVRLAPLTVIFGANSSGKSSLGQLLRLLKQTAASSNPHQALDLATPTERLASGSFVDYLHQRRRKSVLDFWLQWQLTPPMRIANALDERTHPTGEVLRLHSRIRADARGQAQTECFDYTLLHANRPVFRSRHSEAELSTWPWKLRPAAGRREALVKPQKFYRYADHNLLRYRNADVLGELALQTERMLEQLRFVGPVRASAKRTYGWTGDQHVDVGYDGVHAVPVLLSALQAHRLRKSDHRDARPRADTRIADWLRSLGLIDQLRLRPISGTKGEYEVRVRTYAGAPEVSLGDVGVSVAQLLPVLVQIACVPPRGIVWVEQPEVHLHPMAQSHLADVFIAALSQPGVSPCGQLVIETHSEHLLTRLQRRVAEGVIAPEDMAVHFVRRSGHAAELEPLRLNADGDIENWPEHFFGDEMGDIVARTLAALSRRESRT